ncbi:MAG: PilN domain-containing protein [Gammaproteobacteria bacterium]|nr:PilN domain-containing protein [Gammaproteobacteria bacterium]
MSIPAMRLDFASTGRRPRKGPIALVAIGIVSLALTLATYQQFRGRADGLELRLAAFTGMPGASSAPAGDSSKAFADADAVVAELATPWGQLLADLEQAATDSRDSVALLAIEPDRENGQVKIVAESRTLPAAVAFTRRLQESGALMYPMLDSHEIQTDDRFRPVRFQITATWRLKS